MVFFTNIEDNNYVQHDIFIITLIISWIRITSMDNPIFTNIEACYQNRNSS